MAINIGHFYHAIVVTITSTPFCACTSPRYENAAQLNQAEQLRRLLCSIVSSMKMLSSSVACRMLMKYVTEVEPSVVDSFSRTAPDDIVEAIRITVGSLLGSLPAQFFEVNVVTLGDNMRSLMYSFLMTGYMYRHITDKLDLQSDVSNALSRGFEEELAFKKRKNRRPRDQFAEVRPSLFSHLSSRTAEHQNELLNDEDMQA
jgi:hypothetical protein